MQYIGRNTMSNFKHQSRLIDLTRASALIILGKFMGSSVRAIIKNRQENIKTILMIIIDFESLGNLEILELGNS